MSVKNTILMCIYIHWIFYNNKNLRFVKCFIYMEITCHAEQSSEFRSMNMSTLCLKMFPIGFLFCTRVIYLHFPWWHLAIRKKLRLWKKIMAGIIGFGFKPFVFDSNGCDIYLHYNDHFFQPLVTNSDLNKSRNS